MNKKILLFALSLFLILSMTGCAQNTNNNSGVTQVADKIEVVHFRATQQCWSCVTVGQYALETIQQRFPQEYQSGKIVFKEINGELPVNRDMVTKYQARGSSLFVNAIIDEDDHIKEDVTVWRLVNNKKQFMDYFENKLNQLLNK